MKRNRWICICLTALLLCALSAPAFAVLSHEQAQRIQQSWREDKAQQTDATTSATQSVGASYDYIIFVTKEAKREMKKYKTLKQGDKSAAVKKMKERLIDLGYLPDTCDLSKRFDGETKDALYAFQVSNNLTGSDGLSYPYTQY